MFFFLSFIFFFYKVEEQEDGTGSARVRGWHQWEEGGGRERDRRVNMVQIMCTHICKYKNDTC
jgi:hypothetical protein